MKKRTYTIAVMGLLFAVAIILSYLESIIPTFIPVPGIKIGLSNIVVMYCLFYLGSRYAACLVVLKGGFVLLTRGAIAALLSLGGGVFSVLAMVLVYKLLKGSYIFTSIIGGAFHNIGQIVVASFLLNTVEIYYYYLPILIIAGIIVGFLTGNFLRIILPAIQKSLNKKL